MSDTTPATLKDLHRIREQICEEEQHLSPQERIARTRRAADVLLKEWGLTLKRVGPPSRTPARS